VRILVVSALYPPVVLGGYELECAVVVEQLRERHDVLVLSSDHDRARGGEQQDVRRELAYMTPDARGARHAPAAALRAVESARRALSWAPDLVYVWNGASIPHASLRVLGDSGTPIAFRVCEHWFGGLFVGDQYMRELLPARRGPARAAWAAGCRALNLLPALRLRPTAPLRTAISWNSEAMRRMAPAPAFVESVLERISHPVPPSGELYAGIVRKPAGEPLGEQAVASAGEPEIVFLGRVTPYKGVAVALEALALLHSEHGIQARLVVAGPEDAPHGADMRRLAERLGISGSVSWRGQQTPEAVAALLAQAHVLLVPSTWDEPFGLVTIEGAFARVPVVAADVGGISEGLRDEQHALLFARGDANAAAAALARTLREPEQSAARVRRAYERAQAFRLEPYLEQQERFVLDAHAALRASA
jgi:glycosyltransferase involved in cell wall biosynthesis